MRQSREIKSFLYSQYFSDGLRITFGVLLPSLIFSYFDQLAAGITISLGALCVSIADNPGPLNHRRNGMLFCALFIFITALLTGFINDYPIIIGLEIIGLCFFYSMFSVYGNRASAVGTAALLVMIVTIDEHRDLTGILLHAIYILGGGLWYFILSMSVTGIRPYRMAQQALGECIREVAAYVRLKGRFYNPETDPDSNYRQLIRQQVLVHQKQDEVRELLFKSRMMIKESTTAGRRLILIFVDTVDLFEQTMATFYDYQAIRNTYGKTGVLPVFEKTIMKIGGELDNLSYSLIRNDVSAPGYDFNKDLLTLKSSIDRVESEFGITNLVLKKILINVRNMADRTRKIYSYFNPRQVAREKIRSVSDLPKFVSHQDFDFKILKNNLNFKSTIFRHSLRVALVCLAGYIVSKLFPVGHHSYWILLTILVILKPGFSLTKQRNYERLIGTLAGGIIGACILIFIKDQTVLFILLLIFMVASYSFQRFKYVLSVLFMTPYILILFSFLGANSISLAGERIVDTLIGSLIALIGSHFILPSWEYVQFGTFMREMLKANYNYLLKAADALSGKPIDITEYKLARKDVYVSSANIGSAFQRMLSEPRSKQKNVKDLHKFVVLNHSLASYTATLISDLQQIDPKAINSGHTRLLKRSLHALCEIIRQTGEPDFQTKEVIFPAAKDVPETENNYDSALLTEQLEFVNKLTGDIQKVAEKWTD